MNPRRRRGYIPPRSAPTDDRARVHTIVSPAATGASEGKPGEAKGGAAAAKPPPSRARRFLANLITLIVALAISGALAELIFTVMERNENAKAYHKGQGGVPLKDPRWGWKMAPSGFEDGTAEFQVKGHVNEMFMDDVAVDPVADATKTRVMGLGDSHTFAVGVDMDQTWVKVLEKKLEKAYPGQAFRTYNAGCPGYNLHQYLLRLIDQGPVLKPSYVVVGFSYATDFYDLLPPAAKQSCSPAPGRCGGPGKVRRSP